MKVLYIIWEAFATEDIKQELIRRGYEVDYHRMSRKENTDSNQRIEQELIKKMSE